MVRLAGFEYRLWRYFGGASTAGPNPLVPDRKLESNQLVYPGCLLMVRLAGFEPATYGLEVRCSIQLSYRRINPEGG